MRSSDSDGARTAVGSSRISSFARRDTALRISSLCCCTMVRSRTKSCGGTCNPDAALIVTSCCAAVSASKRPRPPSIRFSSAVRFGTSESC